jgi:predicted metal-dependent RNase
MRGHILGSAIAHFHIGEGLYNIAFTGDFNYQKSRLFSPRGIVVPAPGGALHGEHLRRVERYPAAAEGMRRRKLYETVSTTLKRGGKVIIPAFAVGRSQEVMLALEEGIRKKKIPPVKIYLDGMIREATAIHTTYPEYLNNDLRNQIFREGLNPFLADAFVQVGLAGPPRAGHLGRALRHHNHERYAERRAGDGVSQGPRPRRA